MKFGNVNKSSTVNRFVLHTLQRNITHLAVITRKTNIKLGIFQEGKLENSQKSSFQSSPNIYIIINRSQIFFFYPLSVRHRRSINNKIQFWTHRLSGQKSNTFMFDKSNIKITISLYQLEQKLTILNKLLILETHKR